jgi:hypothetical protein
VLAAIAKHGFHLTHVAVNAELQAMSGQHQERLGAVIDCLDQAQSFPKKARARE